jgi:hypothetical protein
VRAEDHRESDEVHAEQEGDRRRQRAVGVAGTDDPVEVQPTRPAPRVTEGNIAEHYTTN